MPAVARKGSGSPLGIEITCVCKVSWHGSGPLLEVKYLCLQVSWRGYKKLNSVSLEDQHMLLTPAPRRIMQLESNLNHGSTSGISMLYHEGCIFTVR